MRAWPFDPAAQRYVSLATFRRDGREVRTPVWLIGLNASYYLFSARDAGKVKRIRANGQAKMASCDVRGAVSSAWLDARAHIVTDEALIAEVYLRLRRKYGWQMAIADFFSRLTGRLARRVVIELEVTDGAPHETLA